MSKKWRPLPNQQTKNEVVLHQRSVSSFSGPLPPPAVLQQYNDILPGAADRIIKMAEDQFVHRTGLEKKVIESDIERSKSGQIFGFIVAVAGLTVALIAILNNHEVAGGVIGGATLVSLVSVFVYGTNSRKKEREEKEDGVEE